MSKLNEYLEKINLDLLRCPICHEKFNLVDKAFICCNNHTYNLNKKGYINLEPQKKLKHYDTALFKARYQILNNDYYQPLVVLIKDLINKYQLNDSSILDVGCGEGSFLNMLTTNNYGIDLSKDGVECAASFKSSNAFIVADLANIPFIDKNFDMLLNILTPANYEEFNRVLKDDGYIIKVIPLEKYLKEFKKLLNIELKDNDKVKDNLLKHTSIIETQQVDYQVNVLPEDYQAFIKMSPLMNSLTDIQITEFVELFPEKLSIHLEVLVLKINKIN